MKMPVRWIVAALVPVAGAVSAVPVMTPSASASSAATANWSTLEQTGLGAASAYRGDGALTAVGSASPVSDSTVTTASGVISVAQRTVVADDTSGTVLLNLTLLGGRQLVVTELSPGAGFAGATLVLKPGTSTVAGTYPRPGNDGTATTTGAARGGSIAAETSTATLREVLSPTHRSRHSVDRLVTIGGCAPYPAAPGVIGSTFGPLVQGEGVIECGTTETLSQVVSDYRGGTHVGTTATGSDRSTVLDVNAYYGCTVIGGTNGFHTAELWSVHGTLQGGATSGTANLHCA
jgi:hypothetical protein